MTGEMPAACRFIAVVGGSGSGKSWLARRLHAALGEKAAHLYLDDFYRDLGHLPEADRGKVNFDDPAAIDWDSLRQVIETLQRDENASIPSYDFATHLRNGTRELPAPRILVMEGLWLLHPEWLRDVFSVSVFVECSAEERLRRRVERDVLERGRSRESIMQQFSEHVQPMHLQFVEPQRVLADRVVNSPVTDEEFAALVEVCSPAL
ncbi:MAG: AAA family ATPase [Luteolibacter sp.]